MEWIVLVKKENASKAEEAIRKDFDVAARQSITIRDCATLGITEAKGAIFYISGTDEGVAKCKELIKGFVEKADQKVLDHAKKKIRDEEDAAASGMGSIFG